MTPAQPLRIAILFSELAGYSLACFRELKERHGAELMLVHWKAVGEAPFAHGDLDWIDRRIEREGRSAEELDREVERFAPDAVLMSGWMDRGYMKVARSSRRRGTPVIAGLDGQWRGTLRQWAGVGAAPRLLHPAIDVIWAAGERQAQFAAKLGYRGGRCWRGVYACDWPRFARDPALVPGDHDDAPPRFLYVGRYVPGKGLEDLLAAYARYRTSTTEPWPLECVGTGPLAGAISAAPGAVDLGFVQPDRLPDLLHARPGAFVFPSRVEPWGVALQEAGAAGLPLVCSDASGAAVHLVQDGHNGFLFEAGNVAHLTRRLIRMASLPPADRAAMARASHELSRQFTPARWADTLVEGVRAWGPGRIANLRTRV